MAFRGWKTHLINLLLLLAGVLLIGWLTGHVFLVLTLALTAFVAWHLLNLWRIGRWLRDTSKPVPDANGIWRDIFRAMDINFRRNSEQTKRYQSMVRSFTGLAHALPDAAIVVDAADNITWFNQKAQSLLNLKDPDDLRQPLTNFVRGPDFADWLAVQSGIKSPLELPSPGRENRWLNAMAAPIAENQRLIVLRDTTEIHNVEQVRRDFVANISHELRTPLTVLQGYLEMLEAHESSDVSNAVRKMLTQTAHMRSMLDDLLELSRLQSDEIGEEEDVVDVPAMLTQLHEQAEEISRGEHQLRWDIDQKLKLRGVASDLESAISNLINNAIKYTHEGGTVEVTWRMDANLPTLTVRDTGIGIPQREIPRITERFYRVGSDRGRETGGTGLGLAIVKHVLNAHHATLSIESELGEGSTFRCAFPKDRARMARAEAD